MRSSVAINSESLIALLAADPAKGLYSDFPSLV